MIVADLPPGRERLPRNTLPKPLDAEEGLRVSVLLLLGCSFGREELTCLSEAPLRVGASLAGWLPSMTSMVMSPVLVPEVLSGGGPGQLLQGLNGIGDIVRLGLSDSLGEEAHDAGYSGSEI